MSNHSEEELDLEYSRAKRKKIINLLMPDDKLPEDPKLVTALLKALGDLDKPALVKIRIKADEGMSNQAAVAAAALASVFMNPKSKVSPMEVLDLDDGEIRSIPQLPNDLPVPELVPGELEIHAPQETYNTFMARHSPPAA